MLFFTLRRLLLLLITLLILTLVSFTLMHLYPGDTIVNMTGIRTTDPLFYEQLVQQRQLDENLLVQYVNYLTHLLQGDWGQSLVTNQAVANSALPILMATIELCLLAMLVAMVLGIPLGVLAAVKRGSWLDKLIVMKSLTGYSIPVFWLAQLLILLFAVQLNWLPITGQLNPLYDISVNTGSVLIDVMLSEQPYRWSALLDALQHLLLPVVVLAMMPMTMLIRIMRNAMLDVLKRNYIKAARARGLSESRLLWKHALPNAMQPLVRQLGFQFSLLLTNAIVTEVIFNWPGMGSWLVKGIFERDYPVIQGCLISLALFVLVVNTLVELYHAWRYPQVRQELYAES
ncbi:ABC transporter permease [Idiomarina xiamenensis]|uniref:Peptide ABC transporter permease n=1 Tax=Idiomarina xiamenensis 10-D-4 TaxID=740709 RepID=K2KAD3_9GAMM|nr:ABC transporter permease [Idiomarina xiamenensis]EKE84768.1 peptide ABC transporter permease [Idiomarina xiamenensis 10-D-4]